MSSSSLSKLIAGRFLLLSQAGEGGMGSVWKARDLHTNDFVAVKLLFLDPSNQEELARFEREVELLVELGQRHPGVVRYIAHGRSDDQAFLVMHWLQGCDLSQKLRSYPLPAADCKTLLCRVAEVLAAAHGCGIVHRDVKPSNLFLPGGRFEETTVLDFGVARRGNLQRQLTRTGVVVGTPEYMAPEQARGSRDITYAADLFALGCVAFEVLSGEKPFTAPHLTGLLSKILFEPAPSLQKRRPDLPFALHRLVSELLEKDPLRRPESAQAVLERLREIDFSQSSASRPGDPPDEALSSTFPPLDSLSEDELSLVSLVLAIPPQTGLHTLATVSPMEAIQAGKAQRTLTDRLLQQGTHAQVLADGSIWATVQDPFSATDQALQAVQAAALIRYTLPRWLVVVSTGLCVLREHLPSGPGFDQAQRQIEHGGRLPEPQGVWLDPLTARLVCQQYIVSPQANGDYQLGARLGEASRRERDQPCVGFEHELSLLAAALAGVKEDQVSRMLLLQGAPGSGKSRLGRAFLQRLLPNLPTIFSAQLSVSAATTVFSVLIAWLRSLENMATNGVGPGLSSSWQNWLANAFPPNEAQCHRQQLDALLRFSGQKPVPSSTTQPGSEALTEALCALVHAAGAQKPVLLYIDNLHWADAASLEVISQLFLRLTDVPILLLALCRPEIEDMHPRLFEGLPVDRVRLPRLSPKVTDKWLASLSISSAQVREAIFTESRGLPQFVQWLAEDALSGKTTGRQAVQAMFQARARRLDAQHRLVLRAASVLPENFTDADLLGLLPASFSLSQLDRALCLLQDRDWLAKNQTEGQSAEYRFRSPLQRSALSATLTPADVRVAAALRGTDKNQQL